MPKKLKNGPIINMLSSQAIFLVIKFNKILNISRLSKTENWK